MASVVDEQKSFVLYKVTADDLKDELVLLEADLSKTPPPALRSLQFSESELTKTYESFVTYWSNCQNVFEDITAINF